MKVAIRVDASQEIGTGHVRRCLAQAHALRAIGADIVFVTRALGVDSPGLIKSSDFEVLQLDAPAKEYDFADDLISHAGWAKVQWREDAEETIDTLKDWSPDWVLIDHYSFGKNWHDLVAACLNCKIAVIDDLADRDLGCDLLIDHNFARDHGDKYRGRIAESTKMATGPAFALLGPAYTDAAKYEFSEEVRSIGVFLGGVDQPNCTQIILDSLASMNFSGTIEVVVTDANPHVRSLKEYSAKKEQIRLTENLPDLASFFGRHDLQIGGGGGATWERCCLGAPSLAIVIAENQNEVVGPLIELGVLEAASLLSNGLEELNDKLSDLLHNAEKRRGFSEASKRLVDGFGARKVAKMMEEML